MMSAKQKRPVTYKILISFIWLLGILLGCAEKSKFYQEEGRKPVNEVNLFYKVMGRGTPVVVLHGGPGFDHTYLLPQMGVLADNFQLIFYDQRTSGGSIAPLDSNSVSLGNFIEDLEGIRVAFKLEKVNLLGHSWGGILAMFYAIRYPNKVNSLMLISSGGASSDFWDDLYNNLNERRSLQDSVQLAQLRNSPEFKSHQVLAVEQFWKIFFRPYFQDENLSQQLSTRFGETTRVNNRVVWQSRLGSEVDNYNILDQLSVIDCPTLIIHGDRDPIPVRYAQEIHQQIAGSKLVILEGCGHFPYIEAPEAFYQHVNDFMQGIDCY